MRPRSYLVGLAGVPGSADALLVPALLEAEALALGMPLVHRVLHCQGGAAVTRSECAAGGLAAWPDADRDAVGSNGNPDAVGRRGADNPGVDLPAVLRMAIKAGFDALSIADPGGSAELDRLGGLSPEARLLGGVDTIVIRDGRTVGYNTEWSGFARALRRGLPPAAPLDTVVVLGASTSGAAAAYALSRLGAGRVVVLDPDPTRAATLVATLNRAVRHDARPAPCGRRPFETADLSHLASIVAKADGVVQATARTGSGARASHSARAASGSWAGPAAADPPVAAVPDDAWSAPVWVATIHHGPPDAGLLARARQAGCRTVDGALTAAYRAAGTFKLVTGREPDAGRMVAHAVRLVSGEGHEREVRHGVRSG